MKSNNGDKKELSAALEAHFAGKSGRMRGIVLEGRLAGNSVEVSDSSGYFFVSKALHKHVKDKGPKNFTMTLKGWEFESPAGQPSRVDIQAKEVSLERLAREPFFAKNGQNILSQPRMKTLLQASGKAAKADSSKVIHQQKMAAAVVKKAKEARPEPEAVERSQQKASNLGVSKKIQKPLSGPARKGKEEASFKAKKSVQKGDRSSVRSHSEEADSKGKTGKMNSIIEFDMHGITPEELIETPDFVPNKRKASVTKSLKLSPMTKGSIAPQKGLQILSSKLRVEMSKMTSEVPRTSILAFREEVDPVLMKNKIEVKDILFGIQKALIAWDEINFSASALELLHQNPQWLTDPDLLSNA